MKKNFWAVAAMLLVGGAALAALDIRAALNWFKGGAVIGSTSAITNTTNIIYGSHATRINYDFPACDTYGAGPVTACVHHTPAFWLDGGQVGDVCAVGTNVTVADGGLLDDVTFDCMVVTPNRAIVRARVVNTDAGLTNIGDAGYWVRTFSNQTQY